MFDLFLQLSFVYAHKLLIIHSYMSIRKCKVRLLELVDQSSKPIICAQEDNLSFISFLEKVLLHQASQPQQMKTTVSGQTHNNVLMFSSFHPLSEYKVSTSTKVGASLCLS